MQEAALLQLAAQEGGFSITKYMLLNLICFIFTKLSEQIYKG